MVLSHLRRNAVAYLALAIACTTGTAYAADKLPPGSVTVKALAKNAVTGPKIKNGAVTGADIRDRSLHATDLAEGVLFDPRDVMVENVGVTVLPTEKPDLLSLHSISTDRYFRGGHVLIRYFSTQAALGCSVGSGFLGLYVDGSPIALRRGLPSPLDARPLEILATTQIPPGVHKISAGVDCPSGNPQTNLFGATTFMFQRLGD
jgi:hypothetical protein